MAEPRVVVVLGGPNGAGKTTSAGTVLRDLGITEFVNADIIERDITTPESGSQAFAAGRMMLARIDELRDRGESFAFETTLASRTFAPLLRQLSDDGYQAHLVYVWLREPEMSIQRVAHRVSLGGHDVPSDVIRRRYERGLANFFNLYRPLAHTWRVYDNSDDAPVLVAERLAGESEIVLLPPVWRAMREKAGLR
jgi:predicted ABC-type ATPase